MGGDLTFKMFYDQAIIAEQRRKSFQEIGESGAKLDPGSVACLAMLDSDQMSQPGDGGVAAATINYSGGGANYSSSQLYGGRVSGGHGRNFTKCKRIATLLLLLAAADVTRDVTCRHSRYPL